MKSDDPWGTPNPIPQPVIDPTEDNLDRASRGLSVHNAPGWLLIDPLHPSRAVHTTSVADDPKSRAKVLTLEEIVARDLARKKKEDADGRVRDEKAKKRELVAAEEGRLRDEMSKKIQAKNVKPRKSPGEIKTSKADALGKAHGAWVAKMRARSEDRIVGPESHDDEWTLTEAARETGRSITFFASRCYDGRLSSRKEGLYVYIKREDAKKAASDSHHKKIRKGPTLEDRIAKGVERLKPKIKTDPRDKAVEKFIQMREDRR